MKLVNKSEYRQLMAVCPYSNCTSVTSARRRALYEVMAAQYGGYQSLQHFSNQFRFDVFLKDPLFQSMNKATDKKKRSPKEVFRRHIQYAYLQLLKSYKKITEPAIEYCPNRNKKTYKKFDALPQRAYKTESIEEFLARGGEIKRAA